MWLIASEENTGYYLAHHGIKGQKWGIRRYQNPDGSLTEEGKRRYGTVENFNKAQKRKKIAIGIGAGVGGTLAVGTAVVLGSRFLKNRKIIEENNRAIDQLGNDIQDNKEMIKHYVNELSEAEKELDSAEKRLKEAEATRPLREKLWNESRRHTENADRMWMPNPNSATRYYGVRSWKNHPENPVTGRNYGNLLTYNYYKEIEKGNKARGRASRLADEEKFAVRKRAEAESRRLDASLNVTGYTQELRKNRSEKRDYEDAQSYFKSHPLATKLPKTKISRKDLQRIGVEFIEPDYVEPDYVKPDYVKPDYVEPDYVERKKKNF